MEISILPESESNSIYYILTFFKLLLRFRRTNYNLIHEELDKLLSKIESNIDWDIFSSLLNKDELRSMVFYFIDHKAATGFILQTRLNLPESTTYRLLKKLRILGIVKPASKMPKERGSKGGPRPTVYEVPDALFDDVVEAIKLHRRLINPKYRVGEKMGQMIMDEYITPEQLTEIRYKTILTFIKRKKIVFIVPDVADIAAQYLTHQGIKVWR